jgi:hypothetical protein
MEKLEKLNYDTVILGGTLEALVHSYVEGLPIIMVNPQVPFFLDVDTLGSNKSKVWAKLSFFLSYAGLNPLSLKAGNYRFDDNNTITVFGKSAYKVEFQYNNIIRYDEIKPTEKLRVFDYLKVKNLFNKDIETVKQINSGDDFVNHFRTDIDKSVSIICAVSSITQTEIAKEEYSEIYARLKSVDMLKSAGVFGFIENKKEGGIRKHLIKATSLKREVIYDKVEEENKILQERKETKNPILQKITNTLGSPYVA